MREGERERGERERERKGKRKRRDRGNPGRPNQGGRGVLEMISSERHANERPLNMPFQTRVRKFRI